MSDFKIIKLIKNIQTYIYVLNAFVILIIYKYGPSEVKSLTFSSLLPKTIQCLNLTAEL